MSRAKGFDCSEYNNIDWASVRPDDAAFVIIRTTSGGGAAQGIYTDKSLASHYQGAKSIGALVAPYHYVIMSDTDGRRHDPVLQAEQWYGAASKYDWDLPWALDLELPRDIMNIPVEEQVDFIVKMGTRIGELTNRKPMLYSFPSEFKDNLVRSARREELKQFGFWPAHIYTAGGPPVDGGTPYQPSYMSDWWFWQWGANIDGTVKPTPGAQVLPGFHGMAIDQDVFNGSVDDLATFAANHANAGFDPSFGTLLRGALKGNNPLPTPGTVMGNPASLAGPLFKAGLVVGAGALAYKFGPTAWDMLKAKLVKVTL